MSKGKRYGFAVGAALLATAGVITPLNAAKQETPRQCQGCFEEFTPHPGDGHRKYCYKPDCQHQHQFKTAEGLQETADTAKVVFTAIAAQQAKQQKAQNQMSALIERAKKCFIDGAKNKVAPQKQWAEFQKILRDADTFVKDYLAQQDYPRDNYGQLMNVFWRVAAVNADMDTIRYLWPAATTPEAYRKDYKLSKKTYQRKFFNQVENRQSPKSEIAAFALGRNLTNGKIHFVNCEGDAILTDVFCYNRADVLAYFLDQCEGDADFMVGLIQRAAEEYARKNDDGSRKLEYQIDDIKRKLKNTSDREERDAIRKELADAQKKYDDLTTSSVLRAPDAFKLVLSRVSAKTLKDFEATLKKWRKDPEKTSRLYRWLPDPLPSFVSDPVISNLSNDLSKITYGLSVGEFLNKMADGTISPFTPLYSKKGDEWIWKADVATPFMPGYISGKTEHAFVWKQGLESTRTPGLISGTKEGTWDLVDGYKKDAKGLPVWNTGVAHAKYANVVAGEKAGEWVPAKGFRWKNALLSQNYEVEKE